VAWPSREEIIRFSIIVLVTVVVLTAFVALVDYLSTEGILYIFD
jgi:preprotein translocase SecE subunit